MLYFWFISLFLLNITYSQEITVSECFGEKEFIHISENQNFEDSQSQCEVNDANLAKITSFEENRFVHEFSTNLTDENFLIGLIRTDLSLDGNDPVSYKFLDGSTLPLDFGQERGVRPWREDRPIDFDSDCVLVRRNNDQLWDVIFCNSTTDFVSVCERPCSDLVQDTKEVDKNLNIFLIGSIFSGTVTFILVLLLLIKISEFNKL